MKRQVLTREQVIQRISTHPTRTQLRRKDKQGYRLAAKHGVLPPTGEAKLPLTLDELKMRASHHPHRTSFKRNDQSAYDSAKRQGVLDELFGPVIKVVAKPKALPKPRVKKEPKPKLPHGGQVTWTEQAIRNAASGVDRITAMPKSAQNRLLKMPALSLELFPVRAPSASDNDSIYLHRAEGCWFNGLQVFKVGVTSKRLGETRKNKLEQKAKLTLTPVIPVTQLVGMATRIESFALGLGCDPMFYGFDGCTEYRAYSDEDVQAIRTMIELCRK